MIVIVVIFVIIVAGCFALECYDCYFHEVDFHIHTACRDANDILTTDDEDCALCVNTQVIVEGTL